MYIKKVRILKGNDEVRKVEFKMGLNLIVDSGNGTSGNDVGKTTFLRLIDFCLGAEEGFLYTQAGNVVNEKVKQFLRENNILIELTLVEGWNKKSPVHVIRRNFSSNRREKVFEVDGVRLATKNASKILAENLFPCFDFSKPSFREIIHHNVRCYDGRFEDPLKIHDFTSAPDYEAIYLFMLGCALDEAKEKKRLTGELDWENKYKDALEKETNLQEGESLIANLESEIRRLQERIDAFYVNEQINVNLSDLRRVREDMREVSSEVARLRVRKNIIESSVRAFERSSTLLSTDSVRKIYAEAKILFPDIQKKFEELIDFHNAMIDEKVEIIKDELSDLSNEINVKEAELSQLREENDRLASEYERNISSRQLKDDVDSLGKKLVECQEIKSRVNQIKARDAVICDITNKLDIINQGIHSHDFREKLVERVQRFNEIFSPLVKRICKTNNELIFTVKKVRGKKVYAFSLQNPDFSDGAKHKVIFCYDVAYSLFARAYSIPHFDFLLNDRKESVDHNQLIEMSKVAGEKSLQWVVAILADKLPSDLAKQENVVLELSELSKLFRIEEYSAPL